MNPRRGWLALALAAASCGGPRSAFTPVDVGGDLAGGPDLPADGPRLEPRTLRDGQTGRVVRAWFVLVHPSGRVERHGIERRWYPDGTYAAEREYAHDQPVGRWTTWWPSGALASDYLYLGDHATTMRFWHETGYPSAEGPAAAGLREGAWAFWHPDGSLRQQGEYVAGKKEGPWTIHHEGGALRSRGRYEDDRRVGDWEHFPAPPRLR